MIIHRFTLTLLVACALSVCAAFLVVEHVIVPHVAHLIIDGLAQQFAPGATR